MKIGLFSDPHYSSHEITCGNRYNSRSLEKIRSAMKRFREEGCSLVICLGDLIDVEDTHEKEQEHLKRCAQVIGEADLPTICVMGNHDAFAFTQQEYYHLLGQDRAPRTLKIGDKNLVFLDACWFADGTHYAPGDSDWMNTYYPHTESLRQELSALSGDTYVFMHQNIDPDIHPSHCLGNAPQVRDILETCGCVKAVIQGHYHPGAQNMVNGIRYLTLRAMCENEDAVSIMEI